MRSRRRDEINPISPQVTRLPVILSLVHFGPIEARGFISVKMKILATAGIAALVLTASGVAMATVSASAPHTTAKACVTSKGVLKLVQGSRCPGGTKSFSVLAQGGPGTALGYAHIKSGDVLDASRSYNVKASNVVSTGNGWVCFKGLKFTPHNIQISLDYNGILNGQIPETSVILPPVPSECGLTSAQAEIFTGLVNPTVFTKGSTFGFYIVFY